MMAERGATPPASAVAREWRLSRWSWQSSRAALCKRRGEEAHQSHDIKWLQVLCIKQVVISVEDGSVEIKVARHLLCHKVKCRLLKFMAQPSLHFMYEWK